MMKDKVGASVEEREIIELIDRLSRAAGVLDGKYARNYIEILSPSLKKAASYGEPYLTWSIRVNLGGKYTPDWVSVFDASTWGTSPQAPVYQRDWGAINVRRFRPGKWIDFLTRLVYETEIENLGRQMRDNRRKREDSRVAFLPIDDSSIFP